MKIVSKQHIVEQTVRNLNKLEDGLRFVDTNISTFGGENIEIIALDKNERIVLISIREKPQTFRTNKGIHLLKEIVTLWDWVCDFRFDFYEGIKHITGIKPSAVPPRLFLIAPDFAGNLLSLAAELSIRIDMEVFTYNPDSFDPKKEAYKKIPLTGLPKIDSTSSRKFHKYHHIELTSLRERYKIEVFNTKILVYDPYVINDHSKKLGKKDAALLLNFIERLKKANYIAYAKRFEILINNELGETPVRITLGSNKAVEIELISKSPPKMEHFSLKDSNKVLAILGIN